MAAAGKTFVTARRVIPPGSRRARSAARAMRSRTAASLCAKASMAGTTSQYGTGYPGPMKIAFIGLGNMGSAMARNLLRAGHDVTIYNRTRSKAEPFTADGAHVAGS